MRSFYKLEVRDRNWVKFIMFGPEVIKMYGLESSRIISYSENGRFLGTIFLHRWHVLNCRCFLQVRQQKYPTTMT